MAGRGERSRWLSYSDQLEEGFSLNPDVAFETEEEFTEAENAAEEECRRNEHLWQLMARHEADDLFALYADWWSRVLRHIDEIPNQDHQLAVRCWLLKDFHVCPSFKPGGFLVTETLRGAGEWLLENGVAVREKDGSLKKRPDGYLDGQLFPNHVQGYVEAGLGFCLATELWLTDAEWPGFGRVREISWELLLEKCKEWTRKELRQKNLYAKRS